MSPAWLSINVRARLWFAIRPQAIPHGADFIGMPRINTVPAPAQGTSVRKFEARFLGAPLLLIILAATSGTSWSQATLSLLGAGTPKLADSGDAQPVVLGLKVFSDVPGQVLGCSFYKSPANTGVHVVSLWDSTGKLLATKVAAGETPSGKQSVIFASPVAIAANQTFTCGYFAPAGRYAYDNPAFTVPLNVAPLHVPVNGGVYVYGTNGTLWPTRSYQSNYWVDVIFAPSTGSSTWISGTQFTTVGSTASVNLDYRGAFGFTGRVRHNLLLRQHQRARCGAGHHPLRWTWRTGGWNHVPLPGAVARLRRSTGPRTR